VAREHEPRQRAARDGARVFLGALDGRLRLRHLALELRLRKRRRQQDLGHEIEAEAEVALEHAERHAHAVAAGAGLEAPADELDRGVELGTAALARAARQQRAGEAGEPALVVGIEDGAGARVRADGDDRNGGTLGHEQDDAVRQHLPVGDGLAGVERPRGGR
jgi:hypothetical protein